MIKLVTITLAIFISLNLSATSIPQSDLQRAGQYIIEKLEYNGIYDLKVHFRNGNINADGIITNLDIDADFIKDAATFVASLKTLDNNVSFTSKLNAEKPFLTETLLRDQFPKTRLSIEKWIDKLKNTGLYEISGGATSTSRIFGYLADIVAVTEDAPIKTLEVYLNGVYKDAELSLTTDGIFNKKNELLVRGQTSLSNIFKSISRGQEPTEEDLQNFSDVISEMLAPFL